jgi:hypothetical protein
MANALGTAANEIEDPGFRAAALVRTASWGIGAAVALFLAVLAGVSDSGTLRVAVAVSALTGKVPRPAAAALAPPPVAVTQAQSPTQMMSETRRLNEQVRLLAADRDRLVQRIGTLERSLEDVTGTIRRQEASIPTSTPVPTASVEAYPASVATFMVSSTPWPVLPAAPSATSLRKDPTPAQASTEATAASPSVPTSAQVTPLPLPRPEAVSAAVVGPNVAAAAAKPAAAPASTHHAALSRKQESPSFRIAYGVDLGGAVSAERLTIMWHSLRTNEPTLLQGLDAVSSARAARGDSTPDVRLIVGPLRSADDAARLCAAITSAGRYCEPALFSGQRVL